MCRDDAALYLPYITVSQNIAYGQVLIKSKPTFRSRSQLIIEIIKLQASGKNVVEVANRRKVKKLKGQNFGLLILLLYIFFNKATEVSAGVMVLIITRMILIL